ncbi:MAG: hypothetical protein R3F50_12015 [Gammaproteobacteria bacterium]
MRQRHAQVATVFKATARFRPRDPTSSPQHPQRERPSLGMVDAQHYQDHPIHRPARGLYLPARVGVSPLVYSLHLEIHHEPFI